MAGDDDFLSRWSRRKTQARAGVPVQPAPVPAAPLDDQTTGALPPAIQPAKADPVALPPVESLTTESDFQPFMAPGVDPGLRRAALKTLFGDPRFNVMDMLDTYVDDYSKPDPLPADWLEKLEQLSRLGDRAGRDRAEAERKAAEAQAERLAAETAGESASSQAPAEAPASDQADDAREPEVRVAPVASDTPEAIVGREPENP